MSSVVTPRTVFGMTLYNNTRHLREATDSILGQTHRDCAILQVGGTLVERNQNPTPSNPGSTGQKLKR